MGTWRIEGSTSCCFSLFFPLLEFDKPWGQRKLSWSHKNCMLFWVSASLWFSPFFDTSILLYWEYLPCTIACLQHVSWFQFLQSRVSSICLNSESEPGFLIRVEITITRTLGNYLKVLCIVEWSWALKHHGWLPYRLV